jgi:hypothetical protein
MRTLLAKPSRVSAGKLAAASPIESNSSQAVFNFLL